MHGDYGNQNRHEHDELLDGDEDEGETLSLKSLDDADVDDAHHEYVRDHANSFHGHGFVRLVREPVE